MNRRSFLRTLLSIPAALVASKLPVATEVAKASPVAKVAYKGKSAFDSGLFYCPYVPLQGVNNGAMREIIDPTGTFKSRYGMITQDRIKVYHDPTT